MMRSQPLLALAIALGAFASAARAQSPAAVASPPGDDAARHVWDLSSIYPSDSAWSADRATLERQIAAIARLRGTLGRSPASLATALDSIAAMRRRAGRLAGFGLLSSTVSSASPTAAMQHTTGGALEAATETAVGFADDEIVRIGEPTLEEWLRREPRLRAHRHRIGETLRAAPHAPAPAARSIYHALDGWRQLADRSYLSLLSSNIGWPVVKDADGRLVTVDRAAYARLATSPDRDVRVAAAGAYLFRLRGLHDVLGTILTRRIESDIAAAKVRNFETAVAAFHFPEGVPAGASRTMTAVTQQAIADFHRALRVRGRALALSPHSYADLRMATPASTRRLTVAEAKEEIVAAMGPLGTAYQARLRATLDGPWLHLAPAPDKQPAAFSHTVYPLADGSARTFGVMTFRGTAADAAQLASIAASMMTWSEVPAEPAADGQLDPEIYGNAIWEAGRMMYGDHTRRRTTGAERIAQLVRAIDELRTAYIRTMQTAELEAAIHDRVLRGEFPTGEQISAMNLESLRRWYGHDGAGITVEGMFSGEWMNSTNLFYHFASQGFPLSVAAAALLVERVGAGDERARRAFHRSIGRGERDLSYDLLREAGVDLATAEPYQAVMRRMRALSDELERLLPPAAPSAPAVVTPPGGDSVGTSWTYASEGARFRVEVVARGLDVPFALAFLPDGRMIVAERHRGRLSLVDARTGTLTPIVGLPPVLAQADSGRGMHDVVLHPRYASNGWIYFVYTAAMEGGRHTQVVERARLRGTSFVDRERLLVAQPAMAGGENHYGGRLVFHDGYLFVSTGDLDLREPAQDLSSHHGKVLRLHDDGRVPADNPFVGRADARAEIWTYGNRNVQGLALNPATGELWGHEHGPRGGDEVNVLRAGRNYGWPIITHGQEYGGGPVGDGASAREGMEQPVHFWVPSIAPSGMAFYTGDAFPAWRGSLFVGAMANGHLNRLEIRDGRVVKEERLLRDRSWRVREVRQGADGLLYIAVDQGMILRLRPLP